MCHKYKTAIITISDRGYSGKRKDESGPAAVRLLQEGPFEVVHREILPDEKPLISKKLIELTARKIDLIITTGGTGLSPRDVSPEATLEVIEKEVPGLGELIRMEGLKKTHYAALSRGVCGIRHKTLIVNLPGSPKAVAESLGAILPVLPHALKKLTETMASDCFNARD